MFLETTIVGNDFIPGSESNAEIRQLLGFLDSPSPNYCEDVAESLSALGVCGVYPFTFKTDGERGKTTSKRCFIAAFTFEGRFHVTEAQESEALATACAVWFVAGQKSAVT